ncbi:BRAF35-HDAC complex BHC80 [Hyphodiscus hymeniophilus]|uniref:BRAF35-HDAC complex BHC80 n=1 Tax=Hyphodiscus hymeniophilus TaxID=353542 RepID=A0A9P7AVA1_9HELO|nr:BRAF35-HDAC complex BHC80 [Hyphodiscus hymeniophilus]
MPLSNPMLNNIGNSDQTAGVFTGYSVDNGTIDPNELAIQQMHALEPLGWRGGDEFWNGPHDDFCFVCGSSKELFGCQTCENCYHADCMTPSLDISEVPVFWFCPHCVLRERHVPPSEEHFFAPLPSSLPVYPPSKAPSTVADPHTNIPLITEAGIPGLDKFKEPSNITSQKKTDHPSVVQQLTPPSNELSNIPKSRLRPQETKNTTPRQVGRPRRMSPPRKKSKYSAFSKEVDKALSVIYSELETAAGHGKSEGNLESKVQALEQQLRMHEGQVLLSTRELDFAREELVKERDESAVMKVDISGLREENTRLKDEVQRKDAELKDWRLKLRSMIGSEFE